MKYCRDRGAVLLSVGELCAEAVLPEHLDLRHGGGRSPSRARRGAEIHRRLQAAVERGFETEVSLTNLTEHNGVRYEVSGRADCVFLRGDTGVVEEIKSVNSVAFSGDPTGIHEAQAMCYAHFLCERHGLRSIEIRLTMARVSDCKTRTFVRVCSADEVKDRYLHLLDRISDRARWLCERSEIRLPTLRSVPFPYAAVRESQDVLVRECYRDIKAGKRLFAQAPTGTGKTASTLYPAVRAIGDGVCDKIFYLTAKASTGREALRAAARIRESGARLYTVVLASKEQLCAQREVRAGLPRQCNPDTCARTESFYRKSREAIAELLKTQSEFSVQTVEETAAKYGVCPYELQLELSEYCDVVICDYNYVFDPTVYLKRYFENADREEERYVFLVDEAHNLADRACDMYSASLSSEELGQSLLPLVETDVVARDRLHPLVELLETLSSYRSLCKEEMFRDDDGVEHGFYVTKAPMQGLNDAVEEALAALERWLFLRREAEEDVNALRLLSMLKRYQTVAEAYDKQFLTFVEVHGQELLVRQICQDPSAILDACMDRARATVLFSATLTPLDYFADILGGGKRAVKLSLPSPFDPENCCVVAATGISTRYEDRERSVKRIAAHIAATVSAKKGNYIFYFPSYDYMEKVHEAFCKRYPTVATVKQEKGMRAEDRERFLSSFASDGSLRLGFCVLGGSFSEGVDLPGNRLIGVGIVGVGLPGLSNERNLLKEYYDQTRESGYDYAYIYPGMNRVLQAAGRLIRRESDTGVIVLMDDRYESERYKILFPDRWSNVQSAINASELANIMLEFWGKIEKKSKK